MSYAGVDEMSYITQNGEHRTTVSVRLSDTDLDRLDACRFALARERAEEYRRRGLTNGARELDERPLRHVSRADAIRWLLEGRG